MTVMDDDMVDGDAFFSDDAESNGDSDQHGDVDSEAGAPPTDQVEEQPADEVEGEDGDEPADPDDEIDPEDAADEDWLLEGRFKKGDEDKLVDAYKNLESFASRRENELREQIQAERTAAFDEARKMLAAQQPQADPVAQGLQRHQQMEQARFLALQDPAQAWRVASTSNDPQLAEIVVNTIRQGDEELGVPGDPNTASALSRELVEMRSKSDLQEMRQQFNEFKSQMAVENAWNQIQSEHAEVLAEGSPLREHVAAYLQEEMQRDTQYQQQTGQSLYDFTNPAEVRGVFERAIDASLGRAYRSGALTPSGEASSAQTPQEPVVSREDVKKKSRLESGTPRRGSRSETKSPEDSFADSLMDLAREESPYKFQ